MTADVIDFASGRVRDPDLAQRAKAIATKYSKISARILTEAKTAGASPDLLALAAARHPASCEFLALPEDSETAMAVRHKACEDRLWPAWRAVAEFPPRSIADVALIAGIGLLAYEGSDATPLVANLVMALGHLIQPQQRQGLVECLRFLDLSYLERSAL